MDLFTLFSRRAPNRVFLSIVLGALAGISYAALIPIILSSVGYSFGEADPAAVHMHRFFGFEITHYRFAVAFIGTCLFIVGTRSLSQVLLAHVALDATADLRVTTYRNIIRAPIAELERLGQPRLLAAITADVTRIINGATMVPNLLVSSVTLTGMLGYLLLLDVQVFEFVVGAVAFGVLTYQVPMYIGNQFFERGRKDVDALYESIDGLIYGTKELKLSRAKRERYFNDILVANERAVVRNSKVANTIISVAANYGDLLSFFVIGVVAFVFVSYHAISSDKLIGVVMALLYITGPVGMILNSMPQIAMAKVSLRSINRLFETLSEEDARDTIVPLADWDVLRFEKVTYKYENATDRFALGPVDFEICRGEITFIVGGNGSGKSTLSKLISLHYAPASGKVRFGQTQVDRETMNSCRQSICAIFTDYHLFDRLLNDMSGEEEALVTRYLLELELDKKVTVEQGRFSTLALSDGQKKRLALLVAFLEDRELYIFDEWAADQDPLFKDVFYHKILPALKARNKAVVVISHDDRYFHVADKVLVMEDGQLIRTKRPQAPQVGLAERELVDAE